MLGVASVLGAGLLLMSANGERATMPVVGVLCRLTGSGEPKALMGAGVKRDGDIMFSLPLGVAILTLTYLSAHPLGACAMWRE